MTADEAKLAVAAIREDHTVSPEYHARAKELMSLALGVGITVDDSAALIAAQLAKWSRQDAFVAAGIMDPLTKTAKEHIEPLVWYRGDGWEHGGSGETWKDRAEELAAEVAQLECAVNRGG